VASGTGVWPQAELRRQEIQKERKDNMKKKDVRNGEGMVGLIESRKECEENKNS